MDGRFTPLDATVWLIFMGFWMCVYFIVRMYHRKYPNYPEAVGSNKTNHTGRNPAVGEKGLKAGTNIS